MLIYLQQKRRRELRELVEFIGNSICFESTCTLKPLNIINKCQFISKTMSGQQLPKATMNSFLKTQTTSPFSAEYLAKFLHLSKLFVERVADKSNIMCESMQKKTISVEHLQAALKEFGLTHHLEDLRSIEGNIKEHNQLKRQANQRIEEMLAKDLEQERERRKSQTTIKKQVTVRQKFAQIESLEQKKDDDFDYQNLEEDEVQVAHEDS